MDRKKRAVIYARVSTEQQNCDGQVAEMVRFCELRGWEVVAQVIDHGWSGSHDKRPGIQKIFKMAKTREFDCLVFVKMDRFFRSLTGAISSIKMLESLGVGIVSLRDSFDMTTPDGKLLLNIICLFSEFELDLLRARTRAGLDHARRSGKRLGRPPVSNEVNLKIIALRDEGKTYYEIQKQLGVSSGAVSSAIKLTRKSSSYKIPTDQGGTSG